MQSYTHAMKSLRIILLAITCAVAPFAHAQWQWVDKDGRKVFSDQPPPASVLDKDIVKRPGPRTAAAAEAAAQAASAPASATAAASAPRISGKDKDLEEKKRLTQAADAERKKADEEALAKGRADNCERAKKSKALFDSGVRMATTNAKGEREIMDDAARTVERRNLEGVIARDCKPA